MISTRKQTRQGGGYPQLCYYPSLLLFRTLPSRGLLDTTRSWLFSDCELYFFLSSLVGYSLTTKHRSVPGPSLTQPSECLFTHRLNDLNYSHGSTYLGLSKISTFTCSLGLFPKLQTRISSCLPAVYLTPSIGRLITISDLLVKLSS